MDDAAALKKQLQDIFPSLQHIIADITHVMRRFSETLTPRHSQIGELDCMAGLLCACIGIVESNRLLGSLHVDVAFSHYLPRVSDARCFLLGASAAQEAAVISSHTPPPQLSHAHTPTHPTHR